jgi:phosphoglycolate phosphatase
MGGLTGYTIAFDLDGTLVDTAPDLIRTTDQVMGEIGLPPIPYDEFRPMVGQGARALVRKASARFGVVHDDERLEALTQRFVEIYRAGIALTSRPFPGVERALDALAAEDAILAVQAARASGAPVILVSFGYGGVPAEQLGADAVITTFDELSPIAIRLSRAQAASA